MAKRSDQYRDQAKKAKEVASAVSRADLRRTALEIAKGWEKLAAQDEPKPEPPTSDKKTEAPSPPADKKPE